MTPPGVRRVPKRKSPKRKSPVGLSMTEADLRRSIVHAARECGWLVSFAWTSIHSPAGLPDLTLVKDGQLAYAELKSDKGKILPAQQTWLDALALVPGVRVFVWRPADLEGVYKFLVNPKEAP